MAYPDVHFMIEHAASTSMHPPRPLMTVLRRRLLWSPSTLLDTEASSDLKSVIGA